MHSSAQRFFRKALKATHTCSPRVITVDKNAAYPKAIDELKQKKELPKQVKLRQKKYLNNIVEQDHRPIKRLVKPGMGFKSFNTARRTIQGYEIMHMLKKGQIKKVEPVRCGGSLRCRNWRRKRSRQRTGEIHG